MGFIPVVFLATALKILRVFRMTVFSLPVFFQQSSSGDLMIRNIQLKHSGKYVCMVQTGVDSVSSAADLIVRGRH